MSIQGTEVKKVLTCFFALSPTILISYAFFLFASQGGFSLGAGSSLNEQVMRTLSIPRNIVMIVFLLTTPLIKLPILNRNLVGRKRLEVSPAVWLLSFLASFFSLAFGGLLIDLIRVVSLTIKYSLN